MECTANLPGPEIEIWQSGSSAWTWSPPDLNPATADGWVTPLFSWRRRRSWPRSSHRSSSSTWDCAAETCPWSQARCSALSRSILHLISVAKLCKRRANIFLVQTCTQIRDVKSICNDQCIDSWATHSSSMTIFGHDIRADGLSI